MVFDKPTNGKFKFYPSTISVINGQTYLYGEYFKLDDNIIKDHSLGLAFWSIDEKGKVIAEKYNSWATDVAKFINVSTKGKIDDFGYLYPEFATQMGAWVKAGKIKNREEMTTGFEKAPAAFTGLLKGEAFGKRVIRLRD